jgi:hypothetical protein
VELSRPVEISSINNTLVGPTIISPVTHVQKLFFENLMSTCHLRILVVNLSSLKKSYELWAFILLLMVHGKRYIVFNTWCFPKLQVYLLWHVSSALQKFLCSFHHPPVCRHNGPTVKSFKFKNQIAVRPQSLDQYTTSSKFSLIMQPFDHSGGIETSVGWD